MGTDDSFMSANLAFGSVAGLAPGSVASPAPNSVIGLAPSSVACPAPGFVPDSASSFVIVPASGAIIGYIASVVMDSKTTFFYGKQVMAEDYISSRLYMKRMIWIGKIPFGETIDA